MSQLVNVARFDAKYNGMNAYETSVVTVEVVNASFKKTAEPTVWFEGELVYTIKLKNEENESDPNSKPFTDVVVTDKIDIAIAKLIESSVEINGVPVPDTDFDYNSATGELTIRVSDALCGNVGPDQEAVITFHVTRVSP